nr:E3 ubiquitin-protein ligase ORTHRUS 2-like [Ipomoea batatas]
MCIRCSISLSRYVSLYLEVNLEFRCLLCHKVMVNPLTTPCLNGAKFRLVAHEKNEYRRKNIETQKKVMKCPSWQTDISDFLQNPQALIRQVAYFSSPARLPTSLLPCTT